MVYQVFITKPLRPGKVLRARVIVPDDCEGCSLYIEDEFIADFDSIDDAMDYFEKSE